MDFIDGDVIIPGDLGIIPETAEAIGFYIRFFWGKFF